MELEEFGFKFTLPETPALMDCVLAPPPLPTELLSDWFEAESAKMPFRPLSKFLGVCNAGGAPCDVDLVNTL